MPAPLDLFDLPLDDSSLETLRSNVDLWYRGYTELVPENPITTEPNIQCVAGLFILFLSALPQPVIPTAFYLTFLRVGTIQSVKDMAPQLRVLVNKLPPCNRELLLASLVYMNATKLPVQLLGSKFAKFFLRPSAQCDIHQPISILCLKVFSTLIEHAPYIAGQETEPRVPINDPPSAASSFKITGEVIADCIGIFPSH